MTHIEIPISGSPPLRVPVVDVLPADAAPGALCVCDGRLWMCTGRRKAVAGVAPSGPAAVWRAANPEGDR